MFSGEKRWEVHLSQERNSEKKLKVRKRSDVPASFLSFRKKCLLSSLLLPACCFLLSCFASVFLLLTTSSAASLPLASLLSLPFSASHDSSSPSLPRGPSPVALHALQFSLRGAARMTTQVEIITSAAQRSHAPSKKKPSSNSKKPIKKTPPPQAKAKQVLPNIT